VVIDAHHHVWDPQARRHAWLDEQPALNRRFDLDEFSTAVAGQDIAASVLVQVLPSAAETAEFLRLANGSRLVGGVVGWADLTSPRIGDQVAWLRELPGGNRLVGIRHLAQDEPDGWLIRPDVLRGIRAIGAAGLCYDLLIRPRQLAEALALTAVLEEVCFVLDHGAKPAISSGQAEPWAEQVAELARRPNVTCKLSGLVTEAGAGWTTEQLRPYVHHLLGCFTPGRLMFGSDWPVCTAVASYPDLLAAVRQLIGGLSRDEQQAVLAGTAMRTYRLRVGRGASA
jgi:L-fuconolactonase